MSILQRYRDWQHERGIRRLVQSYKAAADRHDRIMQGVYWRFIARAINARSAQELERRHQRFLGTLSAAERTTFQRACEREAEIRNA